MFFARSFFSNALIGFQLWLSNLYDLLFLRMMRSAALYWLTRSASPMYGRNSQTGSRWSYYRCQKNCRAWMKLTQGRPQSPQESEPSTILGVYNLVSTIEKSHLWQDMQMYVATSWWSSSMKNSSTLLVVSSPWKAELERSLPIPAGVVALRRKRWLRV